MFSIAAINDSDSKNQWEPLAPTKEAQEFHLSQTYHEGLLKLQSKEYDKARELLESVLKDPMISNAQVDGNASDSHLLQLRFLALKNLATVFLQQGSLHYESALRCYLQAVEIDDKDSVLWNQLGTLSCSMGLLSISRWAFEQGLVCSPNNWNCMEKLLEVLIAIGDEVACLSVAELILRHWPSHSRALHVKNTIEESEPVPFAPRGIDKLEPKHVRLKFTDKRKERDENLEDGITTKRAKKNLEVHLPEASWGALIDALLGILLPLNGGASEKEDENTYPSGDIRLTINLPSNLENGSGSVEGKYQSPLNESMSHVDSNSNRSSNSKEKEGSVSEEQPQERRSSRLERLRSRKSGKEESDFAAGKDAAKVVIQFLEPFIDGELGNNDSDHAAHCSFKCPDQANPLDTEYDDLTRFVNETANNCGAYHLSHLLLEEAASRGFQYQDAQAKLLELEKCTRHWRKERTSECSLFLAELYYDIALSSSEASKLSEFMSEVSYHLCKIIESVALDYPFHSYHAPGSESWSSISTTQGTSKLPADETISQDSLFDHSFLMRKSSFWPLFYWLSGRISIWDGNKAKAHEEFCISLSLLAKEENMNDTPRLVILPHCKAIKGLTIDKVLHEVNLLKVDFLLEKTVDEMIEKEMYLECISMLGPLLFSRKDAHLDVIPSPVTDRKGKKTTSVELSALDILIKACEKSKLMDTEMYLNCHHRKLQMLMVDAGMDEYHPLHKPFHKKSCSKILSASEIESSEFSSKLQNSLVLEEVKAISQCALEVKNFIDLSIDSNSVTVPSRSIGYIQTLVLAVMCNIASIFLCKKSSGLTIDDLAEQKQKFCFVDAAIAFCKLQHLNSTVPIQTQVDLIVATHDLLAEYELCCAGGDGGGEQGTFLKFAIKRLLALDMKLKSNCLSSNRDTAQWREQTITSLDESNSEQVNVEMTRTKIDKIDAVERNTCEDMTKCIKPHEGPSNPEVECEKQGSEGSNGKLREVEKASDNLTECRDELTEDEREELEVKIDNALDQCFFCLYGLNLRSDSSYEDDLAMHKNTSRGDYQTKEQCADVFQYILPNAKASSRTGLVKLRRVLRTICKHFPQPSEDVLFGNAINKFLDDPELCEDKLSEDAGSDEFLEAIMKIIFPDGSRNLEQYNTSSVGSSEPYIEVYRNLYYLLAQSEEMSATDKWPGFVLTKEGEEFVQQNGNLFKYDLLYNPQRFESWQRLANIYDEEVDLLLNDGSKHINVVAWRKDGTLPQRVDSSRRRSRRCLLMSLALAKSSAQQSEIHELLALVYYDSLQNVVPFYDQRSVVPSKDTMWMMFCENSMKHFKKAFDHKQDWSYAFYMGKLSEKLGYSHEISLSYYEKAITLNPSAVDSVYRMHASRLKILYKSGKHNIDALKNVAVYSFAQSTKDNVLDILGKLASDNQHIPSDSKDTDLEERKHEEFLQLEGAWNMLYNDCLSALEICVEGDLKHFHKARYMLAQGFYKRGESGDLERAKDELSFCFKSSRSSFTINMWEIDGMVKKGRRKTSGCSGNKKGLEVNLPESSRKFITCIRKYVLFYLKLLQETGDICTLDRAYTSLRADKRFSLCIEDIVPLALGRYIKTLISSMHPAENVGSSVASSPESLLEKLFALFMDHGVFWPEICCLPEIESPEISESNLYRYLHQHISSLERNGKLETIEAINERIRKRFKNPKLSNSNCAKVCRHASIAWCRSLINSLASITPLTSSLPMESQVNLSDGGSESSQHLCVDLQTNELWSSSFEEPTHTKDLEAKWAPLLSKMKNVVIKRVSDENLESANSLLRTSYNFYRESSCLALPTGVNLYMVPSRLTTHGQFKAGADGIEALDLSIPRKLLLWAYTLLHGRCAIISVVVKHCEENAKSKMKKGGGTTPLPTNASTPSITASHTGGGGKDGMTSHGSGSEAEPAAAAAPSVSLPTSEGVRGTNPAPTSTESQKSLLFAPQLQHCNSSLTEKSASDAQRGDPDTESMQ